MDEQRIFSAVRENYAASTSYEDVGTMVLHDKKNGDSVYKFTTIHIHPSILKFVMKSQSGRPDFELVADGNSVKATKMFPDGKTATSSYPTLDSALSAIGGFTFGCLSAAFSLVCREYEYGETLTKLESFRRLPDEIFSADECHVLEADLKATHYKVWISKENNTIRKVVTTSKWTEDGFDLLRKTLNMFFKAGEIDSAEPEGSISDVHITTYEYEQITFNNSITIDAVS